jgi:hypothetical protein
MVSRLGQPFSGGGNRQAMADAMYQMPPSAILGGYNNIALGSNTTQATMPYDRP